MRLTRLPIPYVLLGVSLCVCVILGYRLWRMPVHRPGTLERNPVASRLSRIELITPAGQEFLVDFTTSRQPQTLIYIFSPACGWCQRNLSAIRSLSAAASGKWNVIGISVDGNRLQEYLTQNPVPFPVYFGKQELLRTLGARSIPTTLLVSSSGQILKNWSGAYVGATRADVEHTFSIHLPEVSDEPMKDIACQDTQGRPYSPGAIVREGDELKQCGFDGRWARAQVPSI